MTSAADFEAIASRLEQAGREIAALLGDVTRDSEVHVRASVGVFHLPPEFVATFAPARSHLLCPSSSSGGAFESVEVVTRRPNDQLTVSISPQREHPAGGGGVSGVASLRACDVALRVVTRQWDALLDRAGPDFDGTSTASWTDEDTREFRRLGLVLKRLGEHGTRFDPCRHSPAAFIGGHAA